MEPLEPFTFVTGTESSPPEFFDPYLDRTSAKVADLQTHLLTDLRTQYPELIVTITPSGNVNLLQFAAAGYAQADLDMDDEPIVRWRGYAAPRTRHGKGSLAESRFFAKYRYSWNNEHFILYTIIVGLQQLQYILKEPRGDETTLSNSAITDKLILTIGEWYSVDEDFIYVYDGYWSASKALFEQVRKASWDKVILDPKMKKDLTDVSGKFFDSKEIYEEYGVPWKRGLIFHGPVGNGKTISIKALMHTLYQRKKKIPSLYVKSAPQTHSIRSVFQFARSMSPCLLVLEDIETIVTANTRSYFFNEVDGLENNDGILMVATTNYLDRLDPGLSKRPSRFDRKYLFPLPNLDERALYCEYWQSKLDDKPNIDFPKSLCQPIAELMDNFSFAYMQEAYVATLLVLARGQDPENDPVNAFEGEGGPEQYEFYRVMKDQVKILRDDMGKSSISSFVPAAQLPLYEQPSGASRIGSRIGGRRPIGECAESSQAEAGEVRMPPIRRESQQFSQVFGDVRELRRHFPVRE
ncbi:putative P-loop containing nucleoside triphosphate hydrolase protein [Seiridium unicorne]|uniref:P-loop containing nucleoside triphosphate hydrolase protein n=1 Tax=Seiridium unicorne TaxID=138068 RepID=A0ABR2UH00_9PEZI